MNLAEIISIIAGVLFIWYIFQYTNIDLVQAAKSTLGGLEGATRDLASSIEKKPVYVCNPDCDKNVIEMANNCENLILVYENPKMDLEFNFSGNKESCNLVASIKRSSYGALEGKNMVCELPKIKLKLLFTKDGSNSFTELLKYCHGNLKELANNPFSALQ
jgi:hypothetical protein